MKTKTKYIRKQLNKSKSILHPSESILALLTNKLPFMIIHILFTIINKQITF